MFKIGVPKICACVYVEELFTQCNCYLLETAVQLNTHKHDVIQVYIYYLWIRLDLLPHVSLSRALNRTVSQRK